MHLSSPGNERAARRGAYWLFVGIGVCCLAYVALSLLDALAFQAYANWRWDRVAVAAPKPNAAEGAAPQAAESDRLIVAPGTALGRIEIKRLGLRFVVLEGTDSKTLRRSVGHVTGTALPGEPGNVVLAGHRDSFFRRLRAVRVGDEILLDTSTGVHSYRVESTAVLDPQDTAVLGGASDWVLTLVTCYPFDVIGPAPSRLAVRARREHK